MAQERKPIKITYSWDYQPYYWDRVQRDPIVEELRLADEFYEALAPTGCLDWVNEYLDAIK